MLCYYIYRNKKIIVLFISGFIFLIRYYLGLIGLAFYAAIAFKNKIIILLIFYTIIMFLTAFLYSQSEKTIFNPQSPYGTAKVFAHLITQNYRDAYKIFASNGILFNHESPFRGDNFVTKKIISSLTKIKYGKQRQLVLGNLYSKRDWGHASDYVEAIHKILQQKEPSDYVIATGKEYTIKRFVEKTAKKLKLKLYWSGHGMKEHASDENGRIIIKISKIYFRPLEVEYLKGDATKARKVLKWKPKINLDRLIDEMIEYEKSLLFDSKK